MTASTSPASIRRTISVAAFGPVSVSLVAISQRRSGNSAATSSASRSTPGPQAASVSAAPHAGHVLGIGRLWPQWWQTRRPINRCSTSQAVHDGHGSRKPQPRQSVSGA
jgi:hypothetical protein